MWAGNEKSLWSTSKHYCVIRLHACSLECFVLSHKDVTYMGAADLIVMCFVLSPLRSVHNSSLGINLLLHVSPLLSHALNGSLPSTALSCHALSVGLCSIMNLSCFGLSCFVPIMICSFILLPPHALPPYALAPCALPCQSCTWLMGVFYAWLQHLIGAMAFRWPTQLLIFWRGSQLASTCSPGQCSSASEEASANQLQVSL